MKTTQSIIAKIKTLSKEEVKEIYDACYPLLFNELEKECKELLRDSDKLSAVKLYMQEKECGILEAKLVIDRLSREI